MKRQQKLNKYKDQLSGKSTKKKITTSKLLTFIAMAIIFQIVVYAEIVMYKNSNLQALYVLIGIPATLIPIIFSYNRKSAKENCAGGIVYETAMLNNKQNIEQMPQYQKQEATSIETVDEDDGQEVI